MYGEITLSFTDVHVGKSCSSCDFSMSQICLFTLFAKNKNLVKMSKLQ